MAYRKIVLKENAVALQKEGIASGAITPGMLLERTTTADTVKAHAQPNIKTGPILVAVEDELQGKEIGDAYATGNKVFFRACLPGDEIVLRVANGQNIAIGDKLVSNGNGEVKEISSDSSGLTTEADIVAIALEACDMSDSSGADPDGTCKCEIMG